MLNRKLLEIIKRLEVAEIKRLRHFLQSPYFTYGISNQDIILLFEHIIKHGAEEQSPALDKKKTSLKLFPDKPYHEKGKSPIDTLTSDLFRLTKHFLFIQSAENDASDAIQELPVARFYRIFGLEERFWQSVKNMRNALDKTVHRDETYFLHRYNLESEVASFKSVYSNSVEDDGNIGVAADFLEQFFTIARMEVACALNFQSQKADLHLSSAPNLANELVLLLRQGIFSDNQLAEIYLLVFDIINQPEQLEKVEYLNVLVARHKHNLPPKHLINLMAYLRIFLVRRFQKLGKAEYFEQYFKLITNHLEEGYLYIDGKVVGAALRNITQSGLRLGAFNKVREILENHPPERIGGTRYPVEFHNLNFANYHFALKAYDKADELLNYCNFENVNFSIQAELLLIKIYFETNNDLLESRIKALLQKVRRSKIVKEHKESYFNFLNKLTLIVKYGWDKKSPRHAKLAEEIRTMPGLLEREWLLKQLE